MFQSPKREVTRRDAEEAARFLSLHLTGLSEDAVKGAFRRRVKQAHPDTGGYDPLESAQVVDVAKDTLALARIARDTLEAWLKDLPDNSCPYCKGKGYVRSGFGAAPCNQCL